ncbi:MAG: low molecular weight protein arginine phosphatase [Chloroflexota bacterium]
MPHILFVCTANICRSPVAEGLLQRHFEEQGMDAWTVSSAGTWAVQERGASRNSIAVLADRGIDIGAHQARMVNREMLEEADLVLCMESGHAEALHAEFSEMAHKIYMLSQMAGKRHSIADPYGAELPAYQRMLDEVETLIEQGLPRIIELAGENARRRWGTRGSDGG